MSAKYRRQVFEPSCPAGGEFYACDYGSRFVGCCTVEPCVNGCAETQLKPASFLKEKYKDVTGALCPGESNWWTCAGTTPPFLGCCKSNPCTQNGCPSKDLMAAILSPARSEALPYSPIANPSLTASTVSSSVSTASLSTATLLPSTARLPTATPLPSESTPLSTKTRTLGGIIGGAVGGGFLLVLVCVVFFLYRRRKATKTSSPKIPYSELPGPSVPMGSPSFPSEADSKHMFPQIDGSPIAELDSPPPPIYEFPSPDLIHEFPTPHPVHEFPP